MKAVKDILVETFQDNKSVQDVVKQDSKKSERLELLIDYAIFKGENYGRIYLNKDKTACAIIIDSEKERRSIKSIRWDIKIAFKVVGIYNVLRVLKRENQLKKYYTDDEYLYLWFIGVKTSESGRGSGSKLLKEIIDNSGTKPICLMTSTKRNFSFYERSGFKKVIDLKDIVGYQLNMYRYKK